MAPFPCDECGAPAEGNFLGMRPHCQACYDLLTAPAQKAPAAPAPTLTQSSDADWWHILQTCAYDPLQARLHHVTALYAEHAATTELIACLRTSKHPAAMEWANRLAQAQRR